MGLNLAAALHKEYKVAFVDDLLGAGGGCLAAAVADRRALALTTPTVNRLYGLALRRCLRTHGIDARIEVLCLDEPGKELAAVQQVCTLAQDAGLDRKAVLIAFGGGVCSDVASFAASMIRRGIAHLRVPTTLIGQVDAGIGLKGGVNFRGKKNYLGCFHPPDAVLIDRAFLASLPAREVRQGLAEIVKMAVIRDGGLFDDLERDHATWRADGLAGCDTRAAWIVHRAVDLMLKELSDNPYEDRGLARLVDFGHTFSPAIEAASDFTIPHGDAVAIDMAVSALIAARLGLLPQGEATRLLSLLAVFGLPLDIPLLNLKLCQDALGAAVLHRGGGLNLVLPFGMGKAGFLRRREDLPDAVLAGALDDLRIAAQGAAYDCMADVPSNAFVAVPPPAAVAAPHDR